MEKMKIFVSWSGPRSAAVAEALKEYLPIINNAFELWLSSDDIAKGSRSTLEIAKALVSAKAGIICLTPNNLTAPWILFEAGGIAKTVVDQTLACTVLIDLQPSDVSKPLGEFQHTRLNEKELLKLVKDLNKAAGDSARKDSDIEKAFKMCWPELKEKLDHLPDDGSTERPKRDQQEMLEELTDLARQTSISVLESHRRITEKLEKVESDLLLAPAWQGNVGTANLVNLRALLGSSPNDSLYSALINSPFVPAPPSAAGAAQNTAQERPAPKPPYTPAEGLSRRAALLKRRMRREETNDKK
jgi:hypothetical protein